MAQRDRGRCRVIRDQRRQRWRSETEGGRRFIRDQRRQRWRSETEVVDLRETAAYSAKVKAAKRGGARRAVGGCIARSQGKSFSPDTPMVLISKGLR